MSLYVGTSANNGARIKKLGVVFNDGLDTDVGPSNIKTGIKILGITGTFTAPGTQAGGNSVATSSQIVSGYSAWVNGSEVLGSLDINHYYVGSSVPDASIGRDGDIYLKQ